MSFESLHEYDAPHPEAHPEAQPGAGHHGDVDVLVIGAGPTGLTAACEALRHGLSVRIVDRKPGRSTFSKALVVHARTLEIFETMGIAEKILAEGARFTALNVRTQRRRPVRVDLLDLPWGDTAYPFWLSIPQYATERVLESHLNQRGGRIEWGAELDEIHSNGDHVTVTLQHGTWRREVARARWLIGCDGGRSRVRDAAGLRLERSDAGATFVLADVRTTADLVEDEGHVFLAPEGMLLIVPMPEPRRWRIIAHVPWGEKDASLPVGEAFLDDLIRRRSGIMFGSQDVTWTSQFRLSHGLADHYRRRQIFLAGDAAHIHSPVGGQGLNTGVQDAHNLLWKLAAARHMQPGLADGLLDSYEAERRPVARSMVRQTARATSALTTGTPAVRRLLATVAPHLLTRPAAQARLGRAVGMLDIGYPNSPRVHAATMPPGAGLRMPNPALRGGGRLHQMLNPLGHTWIVHGRPGTAASDPSDPWWAGLPVVFLSDDQLTEPLTGLGRVILVRPDGYIAATGAIAESAWSQLPAFARPLHRHAA